MRPIRRFPLPRRRVILSGVQDYSLGDVARILKVSPRRLRYWQKTQLVDSFPLDAVEEGYAFRDLVCLRAILSLLDKGIPLQRIRRNLEMLRDRLPEMDDPAATLRLWDENSDRLVVRRDGQLEEAGGQLLLEFENESAPGRGAVTSLEDLDRSAAGQAPAGNGDALAWFERGCELDAEPGHWEIAIEAYEKAIELEHDFADAYCNLGAVRYNRGPTSGSDRHRGSATGAGGRRTLCCCRPLRDGTFQIRDALGNIYRSMDRSAPTQMRIRYRGE